MARVIGSASFQPQAAAFTSLLHMCAKAKLWQKALEVLPFLATLALTQPASVWACGWPC